MERTTRSQLPRFASLLLATVVVAAACAPAAAPAPTAAPAAAAPAASAGAPVVPNPAAFPKPEKTAIKIGFSGTPTIGLLPQLMAFGLGLFKKYGLDVTPVYFSGAAQSAQALAAGQIDINDGSAGPVIATIGTSSPVLMVFVTRDNLTDNLYTQKNITTAADLKGKSIAISSFGSQSHAGALLSIKSLGLTDKDVTLTPVGNDVARLAALRAGSVAGSMQDSAIANELKPLGFNVMVELTKVTGLGGVPRTSLTAPVEFIDKNPNTMLALTAAYLEGVTEMRKQPDKGAEFLSKEGQIPLADAKNQVASELAAPWSPRDGKCSAATFEFTKQTLIPSNPSIASVDATKGCSNKFLDQLNAMGFQKYIGVPGY